MKSEYVNKLSAVRVKHKSSTEDTLRKINEKKQTLDLNSEALSHSFISGKIDLNAFLQVW